MSEKFSVSMESPQSGWMSLRLRSGGREFVAVVAHAPYDSLRELIEALVALLGGARAATVRWNAEPDEYDFELKAEGKDELGLRVVHYEGHRREPSRVSTVFACRAPRAEICSPFWRELSEMRARSETDVFEQNWRRKFPSSGLRRLTDAFEKHAPEALTRARGQ